MIDFIPETQELIVWIVLTAVIVWTTPIMVRLIVGLGMGFWRSFR